MKNIRMGSRRMNLETVMNDVSAMVDQTSFGCQHMPRFVNTSPPSPS